MKYTQEQKEAVQKQVDSFSLLENKEKRRKKIAWYSLACSIHCVETTRQIMKDINAI